MCTENKDLNLCQSPNMIKIDSISNRDPRLLTSSPQVNESILQFLSNLKVGNQMFFVTRRFNAETSFA